jgi:hypothetical protein
MSDIDFSSPFERNSILLEAPEDTHQVDTGDNAGDENTPDEGFEEAPADQGGNEDTANEDNDDFNIDASDDGLDDTGEGGDEDTGGEEGGASPETQNADTDNPAKQKDRDIFDSLSPQEQKIKTVKLKELFMDLYNRCDQIIDKYNTLGVDYEDLGEPVHKCIDTLFNLKQMMSTYLLYLFDTKTYIENDIMFNRFLTAMNQIKLISKEMRDAHKEDIEAVEKEKPDEVL